MTRLTTFMMLIVLLALSAFMASAAPREPSDPLFDQQGPFLLTSQGLDTVCVERVAEARTELGMLWIGEASNEMEFKLSSGQTLRVTPSSPSGTGEYSLADGSQIQVGTAKNPRLVNIVRSGRPALAYSVRSTRGILAYVRSGAMSSEELARTDDSVRDLSKVFRAAGPDELDAAKPEQLVVIPWSWFGRGSLSLPEGWREMTVQFCAFGRASRERATGEVRSDFSEEAIREGTSGVRLSGEEKALASPSQTSLASVQPIGRALLVRERSHTTGSVSLVP